MINIEKVKLEKIINLFLVISPYYFKDEVEEALIEKFGRSEVRRGNKAIRINGNTYRKETDCVPCFRYRDYSNDYMDDPNNFIGGITIYSDKGERIINYPNSI